KAAYYDPALNGTGGYWRYATMSNTTPGNDYKERKSIVNQANFINSSNGAYCVTQKIYFDDIRADYLTAVGAFTKSPSYYGTFDQSGDVFQWNGTIISGTERGIRGGSWDLIGSYMESTFRDSRPPTAGMEPGVGFRVASLPAINPAGKFTLLLSATSGSADIPPGYGYATLTVSKGAASIAGKLPDGEGFSVSGAAIATGSTGNQIVIDLALDYPSATPAHVKGSLAGTLTFAKVTGTSDLEGMLEWNKPAQTKGAYPADIDTEMEVIGSPYVPPTDGSSALPGFTNGSLVLSDTGTLSTALVQSVTLGTNNALDVNQPVMDGLKVKLRVTNGVFTGSFTYPGQPPHSSPTSFGGVLFQDQTKGAGFFVGPDGGGVVMF
ncbi:MAG: hypothetical protein ABSE62_15380, partial [Chthoniobacteraceae bacterium]